MKLNFQGFILFVISFLVPATPAVAWCNQICGGRKLPFPFGFSAGCQIQLNCSPSATILAADFPVQSITGDAMLINLPAACNRPVEVLGRLFTQNYAPTSFNAILLQNCTAPAACFIPTTAVKANFELLDCGKNLNESISCYSDNTTSFMDYEKLRRSGCRSLFSAISMGNFGKMSSVSLDVQIARIGWWLLGECRCSENAECVRVSPPLDGGRAAYRCQCVEGFAGDGFRDGLGCRRECNPTKYLSGQCGGTTRIGVLAGGIAAGASLIIFLALLLHFLRKRSKLRSRSRKTRQLLRTTEITIPVYPYKELERATDMFSDKRKLGNGAYGTVYSGKLNDKLVAVKRIKNTDSNSTEQVINEIKLLSSVNHPNLVRLLGCSIENEEQLLVYEFMPNGTLCHHLQREKGSGLPWVIRLNIVCETAQAISYLHNSANPPIYHRDIKSSNILLDYEYKSKVADFGLCRFGKFDSSHVSTAPQGTPGYVDPQYHRDFHLSDKSDVYSFGVVLIEIITALRAVDFTRVKEDINLAALAVDRIGRRCLNEIIDPFILTQDQDSWTALSIDKVAELAFRCLDFEREMRPSMMDVAIELESIRMSKLEDSQLRNVGSSDGDSGENLTTLG